MKNRGSSLAKPTLAKLLTGGNGASIETEPQESKNKFPKDAFLFGHSVGLKDDLDVDGNDVGKITEQNKFVSLNFNNLLCIKAYYMVLIITIVVFLIIVPKSSIFLFWSTLNTVSPSVVIEHFVPPIISKKFARLIMKNT